MRTPDFKNNKTFSDLLNQVNRPSPRPETGWNFVGPGEDHGIDFQNGWGNFATNTVQCSWYLSEDGEVRLRGRITQ